jgi:hypothetical protein
MGLEVDTRPRVPFTREHIANKQLVIQLLQYEDSIIHSQYGQDMYKNKCNFPGTSLNIEKARQRIVLNHFAYNTSDESLENYRSIFKHYYHSSTDYDKDVLQSVTYMRENKCVYYTGTQLKIGDTATECKDIYRFHKETGDVTSTTLFHELKRKKFDIELVTTMFAMILFSIWSFRTVLLLILLYWIFIRSRSRQRKYILCAFSMS